MWNLRDLHSIIFFYSISEEVEFESSMDERKRLELFDTFKRSISVARNEIMASNNVSNVSRLNQEELAMVLEGEIRPVATNILYYYGFSDQEIIEEFGSLDSPDISLTAQVIVLLEEELAQNRLIYFLDESDIYYSSLFGISSALAQSDTIGGCLADAVGISAVFAVLEGGANKKMKKAAIRKAIRKVVGRSLGVIGTTLAVYDFSDCMGWL
ncbi:hypothetical protein [Algoriphagus winogradskyi]|uniref:Uncharacterized protein n=1 Tax=Algoriphagus winogradskyi TaxID=237017 RepID=A0ABY1NPH4_9BACT|nr:hypothetical protein [Algoriphagus winogradskyi]SMP14867.1 hypothetical protein SAMN06265367_102402 [Algoriphagus winogradskyi]